MEMRRGRTTFRKVDLCSSCNMMFTAFSDLAARFDTSQSLYLQLVRA